MVKIGKWIGGFLGFIVSGSALGALAGYVLGTLFDVTTDDSNTNNKHFDTNWSSGQVYEEGQRNAFRFSLLVLISYIIRIDGRVMHSEMNLVRQWLNINFGQRAQKEGEEILLKLFEQQKRLGIEEYRTAVLSSCQQLSRYMSREERLQLLNFLVMLAQADGTVVPQEIQALQECTLHMGLTMDDLDCMLNLKYGKTDLEAAYKVLGVTSEATNDEIKAAYRKLALQHHPDRVAALGEDVKQAAQRKFQEINAAKELIWKSRGM